MIVAHIYILVPVLFGLEQGREHDREDVTDVIADQAQDILVVPVIQRPLGHLVEGGERRGRQRHGEVGQ